MVEDKTTPLNIRLLQIVKAIDKERKKNPKDFDAHSAIFQKLWDVQPERTKHRLIWDEMSTDDILTTLCYLPPWLNYDKSIEKAMRNREVALEFMDQHFPDLPARYYEAVANLSSPQLRQPWTLRWTRFFRLSRNIG